MTDEQKLAHLAKTVDRERDRCAELCELLARRAATAKDIVRDLRAAFASNISTSTNHDGWSVAGLLLDLIESEAGEIAAEALAYEPAAFRFLREACRQVDDS